MFCLWSGEFILSCYYPLIAVPKGDGTYRIISSRNSEEWDYYRKSDSQAILVPCGRCIGCKIDYSRRWADRMMLELETAKKGLFLTLTYNDDNVPFVVDDDGVFYPTLQKQDWQLFMKRLRKHFEPVKLRFFSAGEYGSSTGRPHMHAIVFGLGFDDIQDRVEHGKNEIGQKYFISPELERIWSKGFVLFSDVSWETCAYVARYVVKKYASDSRKDLLSLGVEPEFSLMSRRPGIGARYLEEHPDCLDLEYINISTPQGGRKIAIPKYYIDKQDDEFREKVMKKRLQFAQDRYILENRKTTLKGLDYLQTKEFAKIDSLKGLSRDKLF